MAISWPKISLVLLCFQANAEKVLKLQVSAAGSLCYLPELNSSKLNPCFKVHKTINIMHLTIHSKTNYTESTFRHYSQFYRHYFHTTLIRRTSGQSLETCKKMILFLPLSKWSVISPTIVPLLILLLRSFFSLLVFVYYTC